MLIKQENLLYYLFLGGIKLNQKMREKVLIEQARVFQKVDNAIHQLNHCLVHRVVCFVKPSNNRGQIDSLLTDCNPTRRFPVSTFSVKRMKNLRLASVILDTRENAVKPVSFGNF